MPPEGRITKASQKQPELQKTRLKFIDSYFSSSTGHQVLDGPAKATSWRTQRNMQVKKQLLTNNMHLAITANGQQEDLVNLVKRAEDDAALSSAVARDGNSRLSPSPCMLLLLL